MFKLTRSEDKRFNEAVECLQNFTGRTGWEPHISELYFNGLLDLRSPARKAAEAKVLEAAKMRFACCSLATHQLLDSEVRALNEVSAPESAPSVEWRKEYLDKLGYSEWLVVQLVNGRRDGYAAHVPNEAAADVLVAHLNSVESGK